jgi:hypothetical protein
MTFREIILKNFVQENKQISIHQKIICDHKYLKKKGMRVNILRW